MIRAAVVGLGKMGISHLAILRAHPRVNVAAVCDSTAYVTDALAKLTGLTCYTNLARMLKEQELDALVIATPSSTHASMVATALQHGLHVFCEKPFVLDVAEGQALVAQAEQEGVATQVGYHYRFVSSFAEARRLVSAGAIGRVHHVRAEAYGPVVLRPTGGTWRSTPKAGGGALFDYACHAIDLVNFVAGPPSAVSGVVRKPIYSKSVDDEVYCSLHYHDGASGQLCVNWSDESYRKMSAKLSVWGENGRIVADRQECQVYLRHPVASLPELTPGWTVRYTTELTPSVWYYLRGEEYSSQIDYFVESVERGRTNGENCFASALEADRVATMILNAAEPPPLQKGTTAAAAPARAKGMFGRLMG